MKNNKLNNLKLARWACPERAKRVEGFTIIELVISIFVLSIAVVGIYNALSVITILTADSADRLTATYLAQEGMEIVRNIRDTNWLNMDAASTTHVPYSWGNGLYLRDQVPLGVTCNDTFPCQADYKSPALANGSAYLSLSANGFYVYDSNASLVVSRFKRRITVEPIPDVDNIISPYHILRVKVTVAWSKKATILDSGSDLDNTCGKYNCITTIGTLYNWYNTAILVASIKIGDPLNSDQVEVKNGITTLSITGAGYQKTAQLTPIITPSNATNQGVTWSSSDPTCIDVTTAGLVYITSTTGSCNAVITVTTVDGNKTYTDAFDIKP